MNTKPLTEIGLTPGEIKVYMALLRKGPASTGPIAKEAQVSRSKLYPILDKLARKGLVGHVVKGEVQIFSAMEPKRILQYLDEKNKEFLEHRLSLERMMPELELLQQFNKTKTEATLYEGFRAIKNFYLGILDELAKGESYCVIGASYGESAAGVKEFFQNFHTQRAQRDIKVRMLANQDVKNILVPATTQLSEIRFLPQYLITNMTIVFYKKKSFLFFLTDEPKGFLLEGEEPAQSFKQYFETFWNLAKPAS